MKECCSFKNAPIVIKAFVPLVTFLIIKFKSIKNKG